jgi:hypothetical protein
MAEAQYGAAHQRIRAALIGSGVWVGQPCPRCGERMMPGQKLDLDHRTDDAGRRIGGYNGLAHSKCNRAANAWGHQRRAAEANAARSPQRQQEKDFRAARKQRREFRAEFDAAQGDD